MRLSALRMNSAEQPNISGLAAPNPRILRFDQTVNCPRRRSASNGCRPTPRNNRNPVTFKKVTMKRILIFALLGPPLGMVTGLLDHPSDSELGARRAEHVRLSSGRPAPPRLHDRTAACSRRRLLRCPAREARGSLAPALVRVVRVRHELPAARPCLGDGIPAGPLRPVVRPYRRPAGSDLLMGGRQRSRSGRRRRAATAAKSSATPRQNERRVGPGRERIKMPGD